MEKNEGFKLTLPMVRRMLYSVLYGDILMTLTNQAKAMEVHRGDAEAKADYWTKKLVEQLGKGGPLPYSKIKRTYREVVRDFASIPRTEEERIKENKIKRWRRTGSGGFRRSLFCKW